MSNVQLSTTLERVVARRTFPLCTRTGVCRSLFGPVDHDELRVELRGKLEEISERDQSRWNFNFKEDTPLPGNYAWEDVAVTTVPIFFRDVQIGKERTGLAENETLDPESTKDYKDVKVSMCNEQLPSGVEVFSPVNGGINQENCSDNINYGSRGCTSSSSFCRKSTSSPDSSKIGSTQVTDFFFKRKRAFFVNETEGASSVPPEKTPRKRIR